MISEAATRGSFPSCLPGTVGKLTSRAVSGALTISQARTCSYAKDFLQVGQLLPCSKGLFDALFQLQVFSLLRQCSVWLHLFRAHSSTQVLGYPLGSVPVEVVVLEDGKVGLPTATAQEHAA